MQGKPKAPLREYRTHKTQRLSEYNDSQTNLSQDLKGDKKNQLVKKKEQKKICHIKSGKEEQKHGEDSQRLYKKTNKKLKIQESEQKPIKTKGSKSTLVESSPASNIKSYRTNQIIQYSNQQSQTLKQKAQLANNLINIIAYNNLQKPKDKKDKKFLIQQQKSIEDSQETLDEITNIQKKQIDQILKMKTISLKDKIILTIDKSQTSSIVKEQFRKFFTQGIYFKDPQYKQLFIQKRVKNAVQESEKIVFCPTKMITGQVFRFILKCNGQNWIEGHQGISKTFSFILYVILSNYVIDFRMNYPNNLEGQKMQVKKAVYWTLNIQTFKIKGVYELLIKQCCQLPKQTKQQYESILNKMEKNNIADLEEILFNVSEEYFKNNITTVIMIDQINKLISQFRKRYGFQLENYRQAIDIKNDSPHQIKIKSIRIMISMLTQQFQNIIELSSVDIEQSILKQLNLTGEENKRGVIVEKVNYGSNLQQKRSKRQLMDFFIFQFGERLRNSGQSYFCHQQVDQQSLRFKFQLRNYLVAEILENYEQDFFTSPLQINIFLRENSKSWQDQIVIQSVDPKYQIKQKAKNLLRMMLNQSKDHFNELINTFITKQGVQKQKRLRLIILIYQRIIEMVKGNKENQNKSKFPIIKFQQLGHTNSKQLFNDLSRSLFNVNKSKKQIQFLFPIKIVFEVLNQYRAYYTHELLSDWDFYRKYIQQSGLGFMLQNLMRKILTSGAELTIQSQKTCTNVSNIIKKSYGFKVLPEEVNTDQEGHIVINNTVRYQNYQNYSFLQAIEPAISNFMKHQIKIQTENLKQQNSNMHSFICYPMTKQGQDNQKLIQKRGITQNYIQINSKCIDFVLVTFDPQSSKFIISMCDVTVTEDYLIKLIKFLKLFPFLKDRNTKSITINNQIYSIDLRYFVIGPKNRNVNWSASIFNKIQSKYFNFDQKQSYNNNTANETATIFDLKPLKYQNLSLKKIGHISINKGMKIAPSKEQSNSQQWILFKKILAQL